MKVLVDECLPRKLKNNSVGHDCQTGPEISLGGTANRELLFSLKRLAFDAFLTIDRGIECEQNLNKRKLAIIFIRGKSNRLADLLPPVSDILVLLRSIGPGHLMRVSG